MKKLLSLIASLSLVFTLAACGKEETPDKPVDPVQPVEKYSASEVVTEVLADLNLTEKFNQVTELDLETATAYVNLNYFNPNKEEIVLDGYKSGYMASTLRPLSTDAVIVLEFEEGTKDLDKIAKGLEDYRGYNICVSAEVYDSFVVDNYVIYVSAAEIVSGEDGDTIDRTTHDALVKALKEFNFVKEA